MSSFGQWYEQQKTAAAGGDLESGGGGNSVMMIPLFSKSSASNGSGTATTNADLNSSSSGMGGLGRLETMGANVGGSFSALKSSFDAQFPSRVCGMTYPERFRVSLL